MRRGDDVTTFNVPKVTENPEALTFWIPKGLLRPVAEKLYLFTMKCRQKHPLLGVPRHVGVCIRARACSLAYPACNAHAQYWVVICGLSGPNIFFRIIS